MKRERALKFSHILILILMLWFAATMVSCGGQEDQHMPDRSLEEVLQEHTSGLIAISGVVGTAQGLCDGEPCIKVFVVKRSAKLLQRVPTKIEGYRVDVQETGEFRNLDPG